MTKISPNFSLEELTFSQIALRTGLDNTPPGGAISNLTRLCAQLLEPARALLAVPLHIDSGYRSPAVNFTIGGAIDSAHMSGRAADIVPAGMDLREAFDRLRTLAPIDQIIIECNAWIHLAIADVGAVPRRQALTAAGAPGHWTYLSA